MLWSLSLLAWLVGVALVLLGKSTAGFAVAGVAAAVMLALAWRRRAVFFPDGGGPLGPW